MPSRLLPPPPPLPPTTSIHHHRQQHHLLFLVAASSAAATVFLLLVLYLYLSFLRRRPPTLPLSSPSPPLLRRFSYRSLSRATASFHHSRSLGRGASASVFLAHFPAAKTASFAVKVLPSSPHNHELHLLSSLPSSPFVVSLLGYSLPSSPRRPLLLVFELMPNGSLQDALFSDSDSDSSSLDWPTRFAILLDVAHALAFLHLECDPPVVHGDLKPSNVLLGSDFRAKISDFGLSRFKTDDSDYLTRPSCGYKGKEVVCEVSDHSRELGEIKGCTFKEKEAPLEVSDHSRELGEVKNGQWGKDWWWKQDGSGELDARDYVTEWIGSQICPEKNPDWDDDDGGGGRNRSPGPDKSSELGSSRQAERPEKKQKSSEMREWWKEEYFAEISQKKEHCNKKTGLKWLRSISTHAEDHSGDLNFGKSWKKKKRSRSADNSDMFSGDLLSRELSSTTSMRGTVCYVAPESGGATSHLMERADIYSFGVLILVVVSGRRPLHVLPSPMKLEKANLISWCRQLARAGNVLELMDERLKGCYDKEQATLCINLALLCLQRLPELRPESGEVVKILKGEMELPASSAASGFEFSPSPQAINSSKSRRKMSADAV
ncbi:putative receptor-like protein kinase At1g80870 [Typha latifolia]|uniref:putative receptor-like protein kinase At1g80870 n=1 Tax=Typha latifolia TaxID=4733 RepID=UPI003C2DEC7C